jgi:hypothetical protein
MQVVIEILTALKGTSTETLFFIITLAVIGLAALSISESRKVGRRK